MGVRLSGGRVSGGEKTISSETSFRDPKLLWQSSGYQFNIHLQKYLLTLSLLNSNLCCSFSPNFFSNMLQQQLPLIKDPPPLYLIKGCIFKLYRNSSAAPLIVNFGPAIKMVSGTCAPQCR